MKHVSSQPFCFLNVATPHDFQDRGGPARGNAHGRDAGAGGRGGGAGTAETRGGDGVATEGHGWKGGKCG